VTAFRNLNGLLKDIAEDLDTEKIVTLLKQQTLDDAQLAYLAKDGIGIVRGTNINWRERIGSQIEQHATDHGDGGFTMNFKNWDDQDAAHRMAAALQKKVSNTITNPDASTVPGILTNNEYAKTVGQFTSFGFAQQKNITLAGFQRLIKDKDGKALQGFLTYVAMGALITQLKQIRNGKELIDDPVQLGYEAVYQSGIAFLLLEPFERGKKLTGLGTSSRRNAQFDRFGMLLGPAAQKGSTALDVLTDVVDPNKKITTSTTNKIKSLIFFNNAMGIGDLIKNAKPVFDEWADVPEPEKK